MRDGRDLSRFRYHTGATLRPLEDGDPCPLLFRDLGPAGMELFLSGRLTRLAGPMAPILYLRTASYAEPYTDYEETGRIAVLSPRAVAPWHSGVPEVYVAEAEVLPANVAFVPAKWATAEGAGALAGLTDAYAVREALGGRLHDEYLADLRGRLRQLNAEMQASERLARPVRRRFQTGTLSDRERLRESMARGDVSERDLCAAWHHIPRPRREALGAWLASQPGRP